MQTKLLHQWVKNDRTQQEMHFFYCGPLHTELLGMTRGCSLNSFLLSDRELVNNNVFAQRLET